MSLGTKEIISECNDLIRFDFDAIGAYHEAIEKIDIPTIKAQLAEFLADHERHVLELSDCVRRFGGTPAERPGARGIVRKTMTKIAGLMGVESTLSAMKSNEKVLNEQYGKRLKMGFPADVLEIIQRNYSDEQRHLAYVELCLRERTWETHPTTYV